MKLIADAGGTKIEWALLDAAGNVAVRLTTRGYNAVQAEVQTLARILREDAPTLVERAQGVDEVYYYGAGCVGERVAGIKDVLTAVFNCGSSDCCRVESDMLGAARALCGRAEGVACILGTGSNSCRYDGEKIVDNVSPLGFILGDEGSGAVLGRRLIGMVMKGGFSDEISERFRRRFPEMTRDAIISRVYRGERPAAFLASFVPFLAENIDVEEVEEFVVDEFCRFFRFNVKAYENAERLPINFIGSIAWHFSDQLRKAAARSGCSVGRIEKAPMELLIAYHRD